MATPKIPRIMQKDFEEAIDVDFTEEHESWNVYKLEDGTTLKIKLVIQGVKRLKKWKVDGDPIYMISSTNILRTVKIPKKLKAKPRVSSFKPV